MIDMLRAKILNCYLKFDSEVVLRRKFSFVFLLSILFLLLVLKFAISDYGPGFDDPGGDSALVINGAENIKNGNGYVYDSLWFFDKSDGQLRTDIVKPGYLYPPMTSILLAVIFLFHESIFAAVMFQIFIFCVLVLIYYSLTEEIFNRRIAFWSSLIIIFNPVLFLELGAPPRTHVTGLLAMLLFFIIMIKMKKNTNVYYYLGIISGVAYLTRDIYLLLALGSFSILFLERKYKLAGQFLSSFCIVTLPWLLRNYYYYETFIPRSSTMGFYYKPERTDYVYGSFFDRILSSVKYVHEMFYDFPSPDLFYIILPFCLMGIILEFKNRKLRHFFAFVFLYLGLLIMVPFLSGDAGYQKIYFLPIYLLILPLGIKTFQDTVNSLFPQRHKHLVFLFFILIIIFSSFSVTMRDELSSNQTRSYVIDPAEDYVWSKENMEADSNVAVSGRLPHRLYYFTGHNSVTLPVNIDQQDMRVFLIDYEIDYLYINYEDDEEASVIYSDLYKGEELVYEGLTLEPVNIQFSEYDGSKIIIYAVYFGD